MGRECADPTRRIGFRAADSAAAPPVDGGSLLVDESESHVLVAAPTGAGKGTSALIPWLLTYPGSVVVIDPKAEAYQVTARQRAAQGHWVGAFDPWHVCRPIAPGHHVVRHFINPMQVMLSHSTDLGDDCMTLAELVAGETPQSMQDPFWRNGALDLCLALMGWVWVRRNVSGVAQPDDCTLAGVFAILVANDIALHLADVLDKHGGHHELPRFVREGLVNFLSHEGEKVRTSLRSEAVSLMRVFGSARVQQATGDTTLPLDALQAGEQGVTAYLVVPPDRLESHAALLRIVLGTLLSLMTRRSARPRLPTLFLVDELGHLGPVPQLRQAITLLRGYGVRVALFVQSIAQLKSLWPKDHDTILENCGTWLNFGNTTLSAARQMADRLGDISAEALFGMGADRLAIHRAGLPTVIARKVDYRRDPLTSGLFDPNPYYRNEPSKSAEGGAPDP